MFDIDSLLTNVSDVALYGGALLQTLALLAGLVVVAQGLYRLYTAQNTHGESTIGEAVTFLLSGTALVYFGLSTQVIFDLLYGGANNAAVSHLMSYDPSDGTPAQAAALGKALILILQTFGLWYSISGWLMVRHLNSGRAPQDVTPKKATFRIFGGGLLLNIVLTINMFAGFFGFGKVV